jgi:hypothetical protein
MPESLILNHSDHFPWGNWCEVAFKNRLTLVGWPKKYHAPGPSFDYKRSITSEGWKDLAGRIPVSWKNNPLRDDALPELDIFPWTMGKSAANVCMYCKADIDLDDNRRFEDANTAGKIALVRDDDFNPLRVVADTKAFSKAKAKTKTKAKSAPRAMYVISSDEERHPVPVPRHSRRTVDVEIPPCASSSEDDESFLPLPQRHMVTTAKHLPRAQELDDQLIQVRPASGTRSMGKAPSRAPYPDIEDLPPPTRSRITASKTQIRSNRHARVLSPGESPYAQLSDQESDNQPTRVRPSTSGTRSKGKMPARRAPSSDTELLPPPARGRTTISKTQAQFGHRTHAVPSGEEHSDRTATTSRDIVERPRPMAPLPTRAKSSTSDPRPAKRKRTDDDGGVPRPHQFGGVSSRHTAGQYTNSGYHLGSSLAPITDNDLDDTFPQHHHQPQPLRRHETYIHMEPICAETSQTARPVRRNTFAPSIPAATGPSTSRNPHVPQRLASSNINDSYSTEYHHRLHHHGTPRRMRANGSEEDMTFPREGHISRERRNHDARGFHQGRYDD